MHQKLVVDVKLAVGIIISWFYAKDQNCITCALTSGESMCTLVRLIMARWQIIGV